MDAVRYGSAPNFCPPTEEGVTITLEDTCGDSLDLEFLGLLLHEGRSFGFFMEVDDEDPALSSGELTLLEVLDTDEEGQPSEFEMVEDEELALQLYEEFKEATKDLYRFVG